MILLHLLSRLAYLLRSPFRKDLRLRQKIEFGVPIFDERRLCVLLLIILRLVWFSLCFESDVFARFLGAFIFLSECFFLSFGDVGDKIDIFLLILIIAPKNQFFLYAALQLFELLDICLEKTSHFFAELIPKNLLYIGQLNHYIPCV